MSNTAQVLPVPLGKLAIRDWVTLTKPHLSLLSVATAAWGCWLAPGPTSLGRLLITLSATAAMVAGANMLNMYLERDLDRLMSRTMHRPLAAGRLAPELVLLGGLSCGAAGFLSLLLLVHWLPALLGAAAFLIYGALYTPLKRRTPLALAIGALAGAAPPLIGWSAQTGSLVLLSWLLFVLLGLWQISHFLAIALLHLEDYRRASFRTVPLVLGKHITKLLLLIHAAALFAASLLLVPFDLAGPGYAVLAVVLGLVLVSLAARIFSPGDELKRVQHFYWASLAYLPALATVLSLDRLFS